MNRRDDLGNHRAGGHLGQQGVQRGDGCLHLARLAPVDRLGDCRGHVAARALGQHRRGRAQSRRQAPLGLCRGDFRGQLFPVFLPGQELPACAQMLTGQRIGAGVTQGDVGPADAEAPGGWWPGWRRGTAKRGDKRARTARTEGNR